MAVFIPVAMMGGTSGVFYTQFGITMAVAVGLSAVNALTLSPALCALMLQPYVDEEGNVRENFAARFRKAFNAAFSVHGAALRARRHLVRAATASWRGECSQPAVVLLVVLMKNTQDGTGSRRGHRIGHGQRYDQARHAPRYADDPRAVAAIRRRFSSMPQVRALRHRERLLRVSRFRVQARA